MENHISIIKSAKELSKNPLGIIALFIVMVYGFACLLFGLSVDSLQSEEKTPLIWFVVIFPVIVLFLFGWLVSKHHNKLYAPQDFRDDKSFLASYQQFPTNINIEDNEKNIQDIMESGKEFKIISEEETAIRNDLKKRKIDHEGTVADLLIHSLAIAYVNNWFEKTYNTIFGSQIELLRKLASDNDGLPDKNIENHFIEAQSNYIDPLGNWTLSQYLSYLFNINLIERKENNIIITDRGNDFLGILTVSNYTDKKNL